MGGKRGPKADYRFHEKRHGSVLTVETDRERKMVMSAFAKWKKHRRGTLKAVSRCTPEGYRIEFFGISPAEASKAELTPGDEI